MPWLSPLQTQELDGGEVMLITALQYMLPGGNDVIRVPPGTISDYASIPRGLRWLITGDSIRKAAVVHDYLYQNCIGGREWADEVFLDAMSETKKVSRLKRFLVYRAVRAFGWYSWRNYAKK